MQAIDSDEIHQSCLRTSVADDTLWRPYGLWLNGDRPVPDGSGNDRVAVGELDR